MWGLGRILADLAFGFDASDKLARGKTPRALQRVSKPLQDLLAGLLAHEPSRRLNMSQVMAHTWFAGVDWEALPADPSLSPIVLRADGIAVLRVA